MLDPMPSDIAATSRVPGTIMSFATAYSIISTAPGQGTMPAASARIPPSARLPWLCPWW